MSDKAYEIGYGNRGETGGIEGFLTDSKTGRMISWARITVAGTDTSDQSDCVGWYELIGLTPGPYTIRSSKRGYRDKVISNLEVKPYMNLVVDFTMDSIEGLNTHDSSSAIGGVIIDKDTGEVDTINPMITVDSLLAHAVGVVTHSEGEKIRHKTYYSPEPLIVEIEPIDWPDKDDSTGMIAGRVTDSITGEPIMGVAVSLDRDSSGILTTYNGEFHLADLAPGDYRLKLEGVKYTPRIIINVQVKAGEVTNLTAVLRKRIEDIQVFAPHVVDTVDASKY